MIYELIIRKFKEDDINQDCPFMPEEDEADLRFHSFIDDLEAIDGVDNIVFEYLQSNTICITITSILSEKELKSKMKVCFSNYICYLRYISLTKKYQVS